MWHKVETIKGLISQVIEETELLVQATQKLETSRFFRGENSGWELHVTNTKNK
jgi:hypothetical protein